MVPGAQSCRTWDLGQTRVPVLAQLFITYVPWAISLNLWLLFIDFLISFFYGVWILISCRFRDHILVNIVKTGKTFARLHHWWRVEKMSWIFFVLRKIGDMTTTYPDSLNNFWFLLSLPSRHRHMISVPRKFSLITLTHTDFSLPDYITIALNPPIVPIVQRWSSDSVTLLTWPFWPGRGLPLLPLPSLPFKSC